MPRSYGITNAAPYASAPPVGANGDTYWNTGNSTLYVAQGGAWIPWPTGGGTTETLRTINTNGATLANGDVAWLDASAGNLTVTAPVTANNTYVVKRIDSTNNTCTIVPASGTVDGDANLALVGQWAAATIEADGTNLRVRAGYASNAGAIPVAPTVTLLTAASGSWSPRSAATLKWYRVRLVGGGGGGGGAGFNSGGTARAAGGGGGSGGYVEKSYNVADLAFPVAWTLGAGGAGGVGGPGDGTVGGTTTFGPNLSGGGGGGGIAMVQYSGTALANSLGGAGGAASGGDVNIAGSAGGSSFVTAASVGLTGVGAASMLSGATRMQLTGGQNGYNGRAYGGGGNGGAGSTVGANGGNGADGVIIIEEYY